MPKINIWDVKKTNVDSSARPSVEAHTRAVSKTPTAEDYFNSPLANDSLRTGNNTQPDNIRISGFSNLQTNPKQSSDQEDVSIETVQRYKVLKKKQRRRQAMSVSVSEEEEEMLREGAAAEGMTFSAWARKHLFRAMKTRIPKRPNQD